jgi:hypothetical protein
VGLRSGLLPCHLRRFALLRRHGQNLGLRSIGQEKGARDIKPVFFPWYEAGA